MCTSSAQQTQRSPLSGHPSPGISGELLQKPPNDASPQPFKTFQSKDSEDSTSFIQCSKIYNQNLIVKKKSKQIILKNNWPTYFKKYQYQASLMVQWLKIHLPIPGTWVRPCSRTIPRATWQPSLSATTPGVIAHRVHAPQQEKPAHDQRGAPIHCNQRKPTSSEDPAQPKINTSFKSTRGRWEGGPGWGIHINPWLIHFNV